MDYKRIFLYLVLVLIGMQLWTAWEREHPTIKVTQNAVTTSPSTTLNSQPPTVATNATNEIASSSQRSQISLNDKTRIITIKTDVLSLKIDTLGGNIINASLLKYPASLNDKSALVFLSNKPNDFYVADSGVIPLTDTTNKKNETLQFSTDRTDYELSNGQNELLVILHAKNQDGLSVIKTYRLKRNDYLIKLSYTLENNGSNLWAGHFYYQLERKKSIATNKGILNTPTYLGAAISSTANHYQKISFDDMKKGNFQEQITGGWAAMIEHYFVSAWIPGADQLSNYYSKANSTDDTFVIGFMGPEVSINPGKSFSTDSKLYLGPEISERLNAAAPYLNLTVDYGILWFISASIMWVMKEIYSVVGNWGWSIVLITLLIKLAFYKLSATSYRSMANMRKLQPRIETLKDRFGDDKQRFSQALLELYRKEKVNPLGGCLPILVQIPVFLGLYWVLIESVELRQAPFIFWIHDLSAKDPFYILPILMGLTMFVQQRLSPAPPDPVQAKVMMLLPIIFTALFMTFPSGLVLYWLVNNTLSILQQWYIMRKVEHASQAKKSTALVKVESK